MAYLRIIALIVAFVAAGGLGASSYGLGKEFQNKSGPAYQTASAFAGISSVALIVALLLLFMKRR